MTPQRLAELSVVVPVFNEAGNAAALAAEIRDVLDGVGRPFEMIFVNDGSRDTTLAELQALQGSEPRLRILDLDGNCGEAAALCAGFHAARGAWVITLDGDGQNDPSDIPALLDTIRRGSYRVVTGWRQRRQEGYWLRVLPSRIANALIALVTRLPVHDNGCGLKVYRREIVDRAQLPRGFNRFMPAIFGVRANQVAEVPVNDRRRRHGESHYGLGRTLIVIRDLLALRLIIAAPRRAEPLIAALSLGGLAGLLIAARRQAWLATLAALLAVTWSTLVWWNLRRYNRAQRMGVFRVRREYAGRADAPGSPAADRSAGTI